MFSAHRYKSSALEDSYVSNSFEQEAMVKKFDRIFRVEYRQVVRLRRQINFYASRVTPVAEGIRPVNRAVHYLILVK